MRYWTGREVGLNQRFGPLLFPFLEPAVFSGTERIPLAFKDYGRLEARIIKRIAPRLARYRSGYGFAFSDEPTLRYRMKMAATLWRPTILRQFSYQAQQRMRAQRNRPAWWEQALAFAGGEPPLSTVREFFRVEQIFEPEVLNRIVTAEAALHARHLRNP